MTDKQQSALTDSQRAVDVLWHALSELSGILAAERDALADLRTDITTIGERKRVAVHAVEDAERVRRSLEATGPRWDAVLALAEQCRHQNLTNGALLALRRRHTDRLLARLRGHEEPSTYGATGYVAGPPATGRSHISA